MKSLIAMLGLLAALAGPAAAQQATVTVSVTVPPPQPVTVQVSQQVVVGKATYLATGVLTLTLVSVGASLPQVGDELPTRDWPPAVQSFRDPLGAELQASLPLGGDVVLAGQNFGDGGGLIYVGNDQVPYATWAEDRVTLTLPATLAPTDHLSVWTIKRSGGPWSTAWGPPLRSKSG